MKRNVAAAFRIAAALVSVATFAQPSQLLADEPPWSAITDHDWSACHGRDLRDFALKTTTIDALRDAAAAGDAKAAVLAGFAHYRGPAGVQDHEQSTALFEAACAAGVARGCANLGVMYDNGEGVAEDPATAADLFRRSCDAGVALGCNLLGDLYQSGRGVERDIEHARTLYQRSCDGGRASGCADLGDLYRRGVAVERDLGHARALYREACAGGHQKSCRWFKRLYETAPGAGGREAPTIRRRPCECGLGADCLNVSANGRRGVT